VKARCGVRQARLTGRPSTRQRTTLKLNIWRNTPKVTLFATALLASCLLIGSANAQTVQGNPGLRTAPAGEQARFRPTDHRLTLDPSGAPGKAVITEATSRGENAGTTLKHGAVLRSLTRAGTIDPTDSVKSSG
jgi:hypothetical protein